MQRPCEKFVGSFWMSSWRNLEKAPSALTAEEDTMPFEDLIFTYSIGTDFVSADWLHSTGSSCCNALWSPHLSFSLGPSNDMAVRPESVEDWCQIMPNLLEEEGWKTTLAQEGAALMHSSCPWGGYLIKFELKGLTVHNAPADSSKVIVRPEVRALLQGTCPIPGITVQSLDVVAPGEAVVQASTSWSIMRLCSVLFGDIVGQVMDYLCDDAPMAWHQKVGRNYPDQGDSSCSFWMEDSDDKPHECLILVRPETEKEKFSAFVIVRVHENHFARWASEHFRFVLSSARSTAESYLNRPGIAELREMDEQFYVVISMQSFKRGMPLLPAYPDEQVSPLVCADGCGMSQAPRSSSWLNTSQSSCSVWVSRLKPTTAWTARSWFLISAWYAVPTGSRCVLVFLLPTPCRRRPIVVPMVGLARRGYRRTCFPSLWRPRQWTSRNVWSKRHGRSWWCGRLSWIWRMTPPPVAPRKCAHRDAQRPHTLGDFSCHLCHKPKAAERRTRRPPPLVHPLHSWIASLQLCTY